MKHKFGINEYLYRQRNTSSDIWLNTADLINGHLLVAGMSGTGKSYQLQKLIQSGIAQRVEFDIFDVHNELDVPGTVPVLYSAATRYGFNPLVLNTDGHSGGVQRSINDFIGLINTTSHKLGPKQEMALRNLLGDVYFLNGCYEDNPSSWKKPCITEAQRSEYIRGNDWGALRRYYPTLDDLIAYAERKIKALYIGSDNKSVTALEHVNRLAMSLHKLTNKYQRNQNAESDTDAAQLDSQLTKAKEKLIDQFSEFVASIETGRELSDVLKYTSRDVLQSTLDRMKILNASGIWRSNPPPFNGSPSRCHQIMHLSLDEQKLFVYRRLDEIFRYRKDQGQKSDVCHVLLLDEAHKFFSKEDDNIVNIIAKEGRKFGLALWCASPSPTHFSEDFLTTCGITMLLGIHPKFWDMACRQLRISPDVLKYIKAQSVAAIKLQKKGGIESKFQNVIVENREKLPASAAV